MLEFLVDRGAQETTSDEPGSAGQPGCQPGCHMAAGEISRSEESALHLEAICKILDERFTAIMDSNAKEFRALGQRLDEVLGLRRPHTSQLPTSPRHLAANPWHTYNHHQHAHSARKTPGPAGKLRTRERRARERESESEMDARGLARTARKRSHARTL